MKKRLLSLIICTALIASVFSGCGAKDHVISFDTSSNSSSAENTDSSNETTTSSTETSAPESTGSSVDESSDSADSSVTEGSDIEESSSEDESSEEDESSDVYWGDYDYTVGNHAMAYGNTIYNNNATYQSYVDFRLDTKYTPTKDKKIIWYGSNDKIPPTEVYNREKALEFAYYHWDDGLDLCAPFISRCLEAGEISAYSSGSTGLCMQLINSGLGFGQFLPINADRTVTLPSYATRGDVIQAYCPAEGLMIHSLMFNGNDSDGHMMVYCHNFRHNGTTTFHIDDLCYDDDVFVNEVFYFHFYDDDDKNKDLPKEVTSGENEILLYENGGYHLNQTYDRNKAVSYAKEHPYDGVGMFGAEHLSECLDAGGITIGYPQGNAILFQLMRSGLGHARNVKINDDQTVTMPSDAKAGDICFVYCPYDGVMLNSFVITGKDSAGKLIGGSYDLINSGKKAFKVDDNCIGCGTELVEVVVYSFED